MREIWKPHVVVAAVIERTGRFLLIEEDTHEGVRLNQPAGHLEPGESLVDAVRREVLEETACMFHPEALIGVYRLPARGQRPDFLRFTFCGRVDEPLAGRALDEGIIRTLWLDANEIRACAPRHRSPLVVASMDDFLSGCRYPLDLLKDATS